MTVKLCKTCGKEIPADQGSFCAVKCYDAKMAELKKRMDNAVKNDPSHTKKLSKT
ncbi:MAG: hypothetical protein ACKOCQ_02840 [Candidatus Nitrosotenuis sp.]